VELKSPEVRAFSLQTTPSKSRLTTIQKEQELEVEGKVEDRSLAPTEGEVEGHRLPPTLALSLNEKLKVMVDRVPPKCFCCGKTYKNKRTARKHIKNNPCPPWTSCWSKQAKEARAKRRGCCLLGKGSSSKKKKGLLPALLTVPMEPPSAPTTKPRHSR
jgi:hypothetical protein